MATDNDAILIQSAKDRKNLSYKEILEEINGLLDTLNDRLSTDGAAGGSDFDSATDTAVIAAKVQTAVISGRVDALFVHTKDV